MTTPSSSMSRTTIASQAEAPPPPPPPPRATAPPWQVRWKRPQWDRVVVGMDESNEHAEEHDDDEYSIGSEDNSCDDEVDEVGDRIGISSSAADARTGSSGDGDNSSTAIGEHWIPVSSSSIVLTRKEARTAILELHRRGKLLQVQQRRRRQRQREGTQTKKGTTATTTTIHQTKDHETANDEDIGLASSIPKEEEKPTPRNKNTKTIRTSRMSHNNTNSTKATSKVDKVTIINNNNNNRTPPKKRNTPKKSPPPAPQSSTTSSSPYSNWFKSITSPRSYKMRYKNKTNSSGKPPLAISKPSPSTTIAAEATTPSSPTIFSTFNLTTPPPRNNDATNDLDDGSSSPSSPPPIMDASTASSLLWEDMTLTSVSEEDAAAIRLFGNQRQMLASTKLTTQYDDEGVGKGAGGGGGESTEKRLLERMNDLGGGRYYYDRRGHVRLSDWDGFDNVVLTVTIFATGTPTTSSSPNDAASPAAAAPRISGEVVVMELLSTKNPPLSDDSAFDIKAACAGASKSKRESSTAAQQHNKVIPSSPNSSLSNPSSTSGPLPPLPPPLSLPSQSNHRGGGGGSSTISGASGEDDSTVYSNVGNAKRPPLSAEMPPLAGLRQPNLLADAMGDDAETETSNHTRILARRVLWWPSCIVSKRNNRKSGNRGRSGLGDRNCPSFVSLGRTSVWKERKSCDDGELAGEDTDDGRNWRDVEDEDGDDGLQQQQQRGSNIVEEDNCNKKHYGTRGDDGGSHSPADREERAADAMDAFRSLNFLFGEPPPPPAAKKAKKKKHLPSKSSGDKPTMPKDGKGSNDVSSTTEHGNDNNPRLDRRKKLTQPLSMCLVTGDGHVHFFYALRVLLSGTSSSKVGGGASNGRLGLSSSFAAFLMGEELFTRVNDNVMPLSHPRASLRLSFQLVVSSSYVEGAFGKKGEHRLGDGYQEDSSTDPLVWKRFLSYVNNGDADDVNVQNTMTAGENNDAPRDNKWASLGAFDASIDPASLPLRTIRQSNVLTGTCITSDSSNSYLAICGKGLRRVVHNDNQQLSDHVLGGFVTFVSLRHCAEARTIYLPFAPQSIQPVYWSGMHFVVLLGEVGSPFISIPTKMTYSEAVKGNSRCCHRRPYAMAVRADCKQGENGILSDFPLDFDGEHTLFDRKKVEPDNLGSVFMSTASATFSSRVDDHLTESSKRPTHETVVIARFQTVAIKLPSVGKSLGLLSRLFPGERQLDFVQSKAIAISSIPSSPPGIIVSFQSHSTLIVVNHTLLPFRTDGNTADGSTGCIDEPRSLSTMVRSGHRVLLDARFEGSSKTASPEKISPSLNVWSTGGQGWSLLGIQRTGQTYFICWDGATDDSQGPFVLPLHFETNNTSFCFTSGVMPLMSHVKYAEKLIEHRDKNVTKLPSATTPYYSLSSFLRQDETEGVFHSPKRSLSTTLEESIKTVVDIEGDLDDILVKALDSISTPHYQSPEFRAKPTGRGRSNRSRLAMSHQEKSKRLLRQCSSWTQLDDRKANRGIVHGQVIVAIIRLGAEFQTLTLRTNIIANPISTPFNQILSWLCQRRDYYTAASVALSLLDDAEAVYELCGILKSSEEEFTHHKGLLDGIKPLGEESVHGDVSDTLISLADMAVGCLIKGGTPMSKSLEGFLTRNDRYNAPRACLMLVGATSSAMSKEPAPKPQLHKNDNIIDALSTVENPNEDLIWPVRCLIKMAVIRNCLPSAILMLNATIPNELRWRAPKSRGLATSPRPSLGLFLALVDIILESTENATRLFLNMMDEESGPHSYWFSVDDDTKLALCLVSIRGKHVMLQEPEVRGWALGRLKEEIESTSNSAYNSKSSLLPDRWLKEVVTGAFYNAECDIGLGLDAMLTSRPSNHEESVCYRQDMRRVRELLVPQKRSCGIDFDLIIASLLILARRGCDWREGTQISVQNLLNTVCDMAGRKTNVEPRFIFDGATVMRQCALSDNIQAAAFLVGGKKGLVLECADLVTSNLSMTMKNAEIALSIGSLVDLKGAVAPIYERMIQREECSFAPTVCHEHLMWLLEEHVLNVHTYGEFDSSSHTGKIDPVYAGRVCFRAWYCLTHSSMLRISAKWLEGWMRRKLALTKGKSPRRLACAALVRTLLWADETEELDLGDRDDEPLLAAVMEFDERFIAELAQACCGLIQSIPPHLAEELMSSVGGTNMFSLEAPLLNSAQ